jgi:hypothetical protein
VKTRGAYDNPPDPAAFLRQPLKTGYLAVSPDKQFSNFLEAAGMVAGL